MMRALNNHFRSIVTIVIIAPQKSAQYNCRKCSPTSRIHQGRSESKNVALRLHFLTVMDTILRALVSRGIRKSHAMVLYSCQRT